MIIYIKSYKLKNYKYNYLKLRDISIKIKK